MLETPTQAMDHDVTLAEPLNPPKIDRGKGRSYVYGYSEDGIDKLDLSHSENLAASDGAFAAALERAIEEGLERDIAVTMEDAGTERPMAMIAPVVRLPGQIPAVPQRATFLAYRM